MCDEKPTKAKWDSVRLSQISVPTKAWNGQSSTAEMDIMVALLCAFLSAGAFADSKVDESNGYIEKLLSTAFPHYGGVLGYSYLDGFAIQIKMKSNIKHGYTSSATRNPPRPDITRDDDSAKPELRHPDHSRPDYAQPHFQGRRPGYENIPIHEQFPREPYDFHVRDEDSYLPHPAPPTNGSFWYQLPTPTPGPGTYPHDFRPRRGVVSRSAGGLSGKEIRLHLKEGWLSGLDGMKRLGDCSWPTYQLGHVILSCYVYFEGFKASYQGSVKGESLSDSSDEKKINVTGTLKNARAFIEITAIPDGTRLVSAWAVLPYHLKISFSRTIDASSQQRKGLQHEVEKEMKADVNDFLYGPLKRGLNKAVKIDPLPAP
ncbi:uncharacterized protein LOC135397071 [Ornithodoros turicata]|uniref:uncharacterized protein LOC135397071 n=1 Tax=Ornithodoros turicata TaxID=34597 RepID=UPI003139E17F